MIDIGINLMHKSFDADREQVVARAQAAGVTRLVITGSSERSSQEAADYARRAPGTLYATAGVHPHDAQHCNDATIAMLRGLAARAEVVAIGECGLDFNRDFSPRPLQERWFEAQVALACELHMPLFLHERDAHQRFLEVLTPYTSQLERAVVHCFTGDAAALDAYLERGFYIGITGWICDERRGRHLIDLLKRIPLDRLMVETDAPFLTPRDLRPQPAERRNEPAFLPHIVRTIAAAIQQPPDAVAAATTATAEAFFRRRKEIQGEG